jgi:glutamate racemase
VREVANRPIGIFDSGVGGLTVVRSMMERMPREEIIYLGDTARLPYGSKSASTVLRYSQLSTRFLVEHGVKLIVVACNTASAYALDALQAQLPVPVLGVIEPGAREALAATKSGRIGVIGTLGTVRSEAYPRAISRLDPSARVTARACPLLVPLAEEGWLDDDVAEAVARRYLGELREEAPDVDVVVLGCTHYPLLRPVLTRVAAQLFRHDVVLVDSAEAMARAAAKALGDQGLLRGGGENGGLTCCVTDDARIAEVATRFLGQELRNIRRVDL